MHCLSYVPLLLALCALVASQDLNSVEFDSDLGSQLALKSLSYEVDAWIVRPGGVDHELYKGFTSTFQGTKGSLNFRIQRWGDSAVADHMWEQIEVPRTTADHQVTSANFAMFGTMTITTIDFFGEYTYKFENIMLAQYNSGTNNIWIFGGLSCIYEEDGMVMCALPDMSLVISVRKEGGSYKFKILNFRENSASASSAASPAKRRRHRRFSSKMALDPSHHISRGYIWYGNMHSADGETRRSSVEHHLAGNNEYHPVGARRLQPLSAPLHNRMHGNYAP